jgi:hypothetical protein
MSYLHEALKKLRTAERTAAVQTQGDDVLFLQPRFLTCIQLQKLLRLAPFVPNVEFCSFVTSFLGLLDMLQ